MAFKKPNKIKIGPWNYRIHYVNGERKNNALEQRCLAVVDNCTREIWVDKYLPPRKFRFVILHEILHAVAEIIEGHKSKFDREDYTRSFSALLFNALEDGGLFPATK